MAINEDSCLHGGGCADIIYVHIVGTGHYADKFAGILCLHSGHWALWGQVLLVPVCLHHFPLFRSVKNVFYYQDSNLHPGSQLDLLTHLSWYPGDYLQENES